MYLRHRHPQDGPRKLLGRREIQKTVDVGEVAAIELVEFHAVGRLVFRPVPPAPVAAFGDEQLFESQAPLLFGDHGGGVERVPRAQQLRPRLVVFLGPDPDVEIGVDPGSGKDAIHRLRRQQPQGLAHGHRAHLPVLRDPAVQFAQKRPPVTVVIFPCIFAIEDDGHQRIAP